MDELKVLSFNAWGLLYISKDVERRMTALADALSKSDYDIVGLQEIWCERHYELIKDKVKHVLPYSHHFVSGCFGTGCVTLSKYPIIDTMFHNFLFNGYFWDVFHGDWFAGKGLTGCIIKHPKKNIHFFNTHLHADYHFQGSNNFKECRTLQAYQVAQYINHCTRANDAVIMTGDFNHQPHEIGINAIETLASLKDTYNIATVKPEKCYTVDSVFNCDYNNPNECPKRIDYVFVNDHFDCLSCNLTMQKIHSTNMHYSDHEGYEVKLKLKDIESVKANAEPQECSKLLKDLLEIIGKGQRYSREIPLLKIAVFISLYTLLILAPIVGINFVDFPGIHTWIGKIVLVVQLILGITCGVYFWMCNVLLKIEVNSFKNIATQIRSKIHYFDSMNGKI